MIDNTRLLVKTAAITPGEKPVIVTPNAVPLAGGCSKSGVTIRQMDNPTDKEYVLIEANVDVCE